MPDILSDLDQWLATDNHVQTAATKYGVDPNLVRSMIRQESAGKPGAVSPKGAQGLMQLMPATAADLGIKDPFDPGQNIDGGTRYMSQLLKRYGGDTQKALMAYNAGMGNVDRGNAASFPETQGYVKNIMGTYQPTEPSAHATGAVTAVQPPAQPSVDISDLDAFLAADPKPSAPRPRPIAKPPAPRTWTDTAVDALPAIGATVGGLIGGGIGGTTGFGIGALPGGVVGAGIGGTGGEGFREYINYLRGKDSSSSEVEVASNLATEGVKQAAYDAVGGAAGKFVLKPVARAVTRHVFKPSDKVLRTSGTVIEDILQSGTAPTQGGLKQAKTATTEARRLADEAVQQYEASGGQTSRRALTNALYKNPNGAFDAPMDIAMNAADRVSGRNAVIQKSANIIASHPRQILPTTMQAIARTEGRNAASVFAGHENPTLQKAMHAALQAGASKELASNIPAVAKTATQAAKPGYEALMGNTAKELAVLKAVAETLKRQKSPLTMNSMEHALFRHVVFGGAGTILGGPVGTATGLAAAHLAGSPRVQAAAARGIYQAANKNIPAAALRVGETAVDSMRNSAEARRARRLSKPKVDALYEKYRQQ